MRVVSFLPMSRAEMKILGWSELDVLLVTGDAYVDHPAFGAALLGRLLVADGYRVGIVAQPRWDTPADMEVMGRPRLFAGVTAGALDSMLAHYTAFRKKRSDDAFTPGGLAGARPNRATLVYTSLVRQAFPGLPVVIGGIEASLRRASHYDFWTDAVRRSILIDSKVDLLVYGMGERAIRTVAERLDAAKDASLHGIPGTAFVAGKEETFADNLVLPSHEAILEEPKRLLDATIAMERQVHHGTQWASQQVGGRNVILAPPAAPLSCEELDAVYALPFSRSAHPAYQKPIPAIEMVQFSITAHRGCGGGCSFCSLALHQGRRIQSRSADSILHEVGLMTRHTNWKGSVSDVGGPSANMWGTRCTANRETCQRVSCLFPTPCAHFKDAQRDYINLLNAINAAPGVKHVRVASGIRHDLAQRDPAFARDLIARFTGGQLKLAPEHMTEDVLRLMRKPSFKRFIEFCESFARESQHARKEQYIVPYLMSAFPGCTEEDMTTLSRWLRSQGWKPQQIQCFIPTPGTVATAMYHAGIDPDGASIHVARTDAERLRQHYILAPEPDGTPRTRSTHKKTSPAKITVPHDDRKRPRRTR